MHKAEPSTGPYSSVDPAPPAPEEDVGKLREDLLDESLPLFERYRAMFALRNLGEEPAVLALADGEPSQFCSQGGGAGAGPQLSRGRRATPGFKCCHRCPWRATVSPLPPPIQSGGLMSGLWGCCFLEQLGPGSWLGFKLRMLHTAAHFGEAGSGGEVNLVLAARPPAALFFPPWHIARLKSQYVSLFDGPHTCCFPPCR